MRPAKLITAMLFAAWRAVPAVEAAELNAEGMEVLYDTQPWSVLRNPEGPVCDARVLTEDRLLELSAIKDGAILNIAGREWNFDAHTAMVHVVAGEGSGFGMTALYQGFSVRTGGSAKVLYLQLGMLGENVETLNVKDDKLTTIATFPVIGMTKALAAWKACVDGL